MSLQDKLDAFRAEFSGKAPPPVIETMSRATADLIATGQADRAVKVGERAPFFTLPGPDGKHVASADLLARGPLVITFYRGVWCPYCNMELQSLQEALPQIEALGGSIVAISPESAANSRKSVRQNELSFPILTDRGNEIAAAFGIRFKLPAALIEVYKGFGNDLAMVNGEPSWTLPMPARFVIASDGMIAYAEVNPDYTRRPDPEELMPALRDAARKRAA